MCINKCHYKFNESNMNKSCVCTSMTVSLKTKSYEKESDKSVYMYTKCKQYMHRCLCVYICMNISVFPY